MKHKTMTPKAMKNARMVIMVIMARMAAIMIMILWHHPTLLPNRIAFGGGNMKRKMPRFSTILRTFIYYQHNTTAIPHLMCLNPCVANTKTLSETKYAERLKQNRAQLCAVVLLLALVIFSKLQIANN